MKDNKPQEVQATWRVNEWFPDLSPEVKTRLRAYYDELVKFNKTVNLVSPKTLSVADVVLFADSILASKTIAHANPKVDKIYNIASGNGFPGLVFAIMYPQVHVVLLETDTKKLEFLKHVASVTGLKNVSIDNKPMESLPEGSVLFGMTKGFSTISKVIFNLRKSVPKGGALFHLKGEEWGIEVGEIPTQLCSIWSPSLVGEYKLPVGAVKFAVIKTEKIA